MVRSSYLKPCVLTVVLVATTPAAADPASIHDWFASMKRTAKQLRIAVHSGDAAAFPALRGQAYKAALEIGVWPYGALSQDAARSCGYAANNLLDAAKAAEGANVVGFRDSFGRYDSSETSCSSAINAAR